MSELPRPTAEVAPVSAEAGAPPAAASRRRFPTLNLLLFLATVGSTLVAGANYAAGYAEAEEPAGWGQLLASGVPFAASLLGILVAHEMGHFLTARKHRVDASWPYFIPVPIGIGTFGAVIRMRGRIPTRDALVDIGASGPLAGFVVALPLLVWGVSLSRIVDVPAEPNLLFGNLSAYSLVKGWISGVMPWAHDWPMEPQPLLYLLVKKAMVGLGPHQDLMIHPIAFAAVIGLFVTALNLVPLGQLDGGHVAYAVLGRKARAVGQLASVFLLALVVFSSAGWLLWLLLSRRFVGVGHPPVEQDHLPLSRGRKLVVAATVVVFLLTLTPVSMDLL
ncbi:site-2 protease family protein [Vulgatibacter incomptus]|uniref:Peptidase M50 domain-containing protein n=1 Tax=Vulgatibacter incomptus TaxID=1391653 RepID=A0A0K1PHQ1_9BACT|nr:site-2 protease family protein [Vulgatibacter incomptus]AKU93037.1 hypothetical protein AKJ08_3424 [Vulgatibacter incomptus]